jgi:glycosyltransferase involved in cell wall biosynthesis
MNDVIVTVSEFSQRDISRKVGVPLEKIRVIHNGLREPNPFVKGVEDELRERLKITGRFILNVGGIHERKNIVRLIHAYAGLVEKTGYKGHLVITGKVSGAPYQEKMKRLIDRAVSKTEMIKRVVFTNFISERELDVLFRLGDFLVYPSLYEGFGIPVLEAMKVGMPVITSNTSAMPEVAGGAALLVDPEDIEDMTSKMEKLMLDNDLQEELRRKGLEQAKKFSWERTAKGYLEVYKTLSGTR